MKKYKFASLILLSSLVISCSSSENTDKTVTSTSTSIINNSSEPTSIFNLTIDKSTLDDVKKLYTVKKDNDTLYIPTSEVSYSGLSKINSKIYLYFWEENEGHTPVLSKLIFTVTPEAAKKIQETISAKYQKTSYKGEKIIQPTGTTITKYSYRAGNAYISIDNKLKRFAGDNDDVIYQSIKQYDYDKYLAMKNVQKQKSVESFKNEQLRSQTENIF